MHVWNANSIRNKASTILNHVLSHDVDIMCIVETKLLVDAHVVIGEVTPPGYEFFNYPRGSTTYGGGIGILAKKSLNLIPLPTHIESITFEHCMVTLKNHIQIVGIYRPPPSRVNKFKTSEFLEEFEIFLDKICDTPNKSILLGDFNLHLDQPDKSDTNRFCTSLENSGLTQHVKDHTHTAGHILDLVISGVDDDLVHNVEVDPDALTIAGLIDYHYLIKCSLRCAKPKPLMITRTFREYGKIDHQRFHNLLSVNTESFPDCDDPDVLVQSFKAITSSVLNEVCPLITKTMAVKHRLPWYNDVIHNARREDVNGADWNADGRKVAQKWMKNVLDCRRNWSASS